MCVWGVKERTFNEFKFFRVRLNIDKSIENIGIVQTHSFPPTYYCKENGRANVKNTTVFYCSNDPLTAMLEVKPKIGDEGYISLWKPNVKRDVISAICLPTSLPNTNPWNKIASNSHIHLLNSIAQSEQKDKVFHLAYMYDFVAELYRLERPPYHITSMISWELIYGQFIRDFIVYPSIQNNYNTCNMAFHPNFVYNNLILEKIISFKIIDTFNGQIKFNLSEKVGFFVNNKLHWKNKTKEDLIELKLQ